MHGLSLQKIKTIKAKLAKNFDISEGTLPVAFKFGDGRKVEYKFSPNSTIKVTS
jgi:hypothetical protein